MTTGRYSQCGATCTTDCGHCKGQGPPVCPSCKHPTDEHSREPAVGCLRVVLDLSTPGIVEHREFCPCPLPGTSEADQ